MDERLQSLDSKQVNRLARGAVYLLLSTAVMVIALFVAERLMNAWFWVAITASLAAGILALGYLTRCLFLLGGREISLVSFQKLILVVCGVMVVVITTEVFLQWREQRATATTASTVVTDSHNSASTRLALAKQYNVPLAAEAAQNIAKRSGVLTMPSEWRRQSVQVEGSVLSYMWHGVVHVNDENYFRRSTPFPPKQPDAFRLMIVGDSMTYGQGVDDRFTYVQVLKNLLAERFKVEILSLGISGRQSEDILEIVRRFVPQLQPDLVFYGVVHNDFLPSKKGQYVRGFAFPIPESVHRFFVDRSRFARFLSDAYDAFLRVAGLRKDFFDDILEDFDGYQQRFAQDVAAMNMFVVQRGLPPMVAMVLDQYPIYGDRGHQITKAAERYLKEAGVEVIELEEYYRRYDGYRFYVSIWEGHADEQGHAIFASMIAPRLEKHPALQTYRKPAS